MDIKVLERGVQMVYGKKKTLVYIPDHSRVMNPGPPYVGVVQNMLLRITYGKMWLWGERAVLIIVCSHHSHIYKQPLLHLLCPFCFFWRKTKLIQIPLIPQNIWRICSVVNMGHYPKSTTFVKLNCQISRHCTADLISDGALWTVVEMRNSTGATVCWDHISLACSNFFVWLFLGSGAVWTCIAFACWLMLCLWERFAQCEPNSCALQSLLLLFFFSCCNSIGQRVFVGYDVIMVRWKVLCPE